MTEKMFPTEKTNIFVNEKLKSDKNDDNDYDIVNMRSPENDHDTYELCCVPLIRPPNWK